MTLTEKPWGSELLLEKNDKYAFKKLFMKAGHKCSLQYHKQKHETIFVVSGRLKVTYGQPDDTLVEKEMGPGDSMAINPGMIHRMAGIEDSVYLEASTPELDDVVRINDEYGRV